MSEGYVLRQKGGKEYPEAEGDKTGMRQSVRELLQCVIINYRCVGCIAVTCTYS